MPSFENNEDIKIFQEYLRIPTVHPNVDYTRCIEFLKEQAAKLELPAKVIYPGSPNHPVLIMSWLGTEPELPSILLNSHTDVVPVFPEMWTHPPFAAEIDESGKIFARGSQDMKCVSIQYLAAIKYLKKKGFKPKRSIHLTFVPDEEIGGILGMKTFIASPDYKNLNVGFSLDEGVSSTNNSFVIFHGERTMWHVTFKITGTAGHGSLLLKNTVGEKLSYIVMKMMEFRTHELLRLENDPNITIGDVTTINLTKINGGIQTNVVPPLMEITYDIRIALTVHLEQFENQLRKWCDEAGGGVELVFEYKMPYITPTNIDSSNIFWSAFATTMHDLGFDIKPIICPGVTDSRYLRGLGVPAIGFSPMNNTPLLLHDHDEYLEADVFLKGIEIYKKLIPALANV